MNILKKNKFHSKLIFILVFFFISMIFCFEAFACISHFDYNMPQYCWSLPDFLYPYGGIYLQSGETYPVFSWNSGQVVTYTAPKSGNYYFSRYSFDELWTTYSCNNPAICYEHHSYCDISGSPPSSRNTYPYAECIFMDTISGTYTEDNNTPGMSSCYKVTVSDHTYVYGCFPCSGTDTDGDGHYTPDSCKEPNDDCNDNDPAIYPGAPERCDGKDNNCDGQVDEGCAVCADGQTKPCPYSGPLGTENVGVCKAGTQTCTGGQWGACQGEVLPTPEICDGLDNDCNGIMDDIPALCYTGPIGTQGVGICKTGTHVCENGTFSACVGVVTPEEEVCDELDNNCDGTIDEGCTTCSVPPLTPLTDQLAIRMENGDTVIYDGLTTAMQRSVNCFSDEVFNAGGTLTITSAYRPQQYQQHLREVWARYTRLTDEDNPVGPECDALLNEVRTEFRRHGLLLTQQPAANSRHTTGTAIDARANLPIGQNVDNLAGTCGLHRPFIIRDRVHFELQR